MRVACCHNHRVPITLEVEGLPYPQGSNRCICIGGKGRMVAGGDDARKKKHEAWRRAVTDRAKDYMVTHCLPPMDEPVSVSILSFLPPVAGDPYRTLHAVEPDVDKLARSVLDSLTDAGVVRDDSRVFELHSTKVYAEAGQATGALITVKGWAEYEAEARRKKKARDAAP